MPLYTFYKIVCKDENIKDCYVGKTTNLNKRIRNHKSKCNNVKSAEYNYKLYQFIRENGNIDNWNIIEIEKNEYDNKDSSIRERYWIEELNANLNCRIPSRTLKESSKIYRKNNKEYYKQYFENNKERKKEYDKDYNKNNKDKKKEYHKEWYKNNKEKYKNNLISIYI